jgi:Flp pilus assembly protein TadG
MIRKIRNFAKKFAGDERGISAIEIAIAVPVALALTLNGVEMTRYVLLHQKTERATMTVADLVSQGEVLTAGDLDNIFQAGALITEPFDFGANAAMIVSSVVGQASGPVVEWQRVYGADPQASGLGGEGGNATLPAGFVVAESESVIMAEIQYRYTPMFPENPILGGAIGNNTVYNYAIFRPRYTVKVRLGT